nr:excisionase family DNA-binding protein [Cytobacillus praedii]
MTHILLKKDDSTMYLTIKETAEYLSYPESYIESLVQQKRIRAIFDGQQYLINKDQFTTHLQQVEKYREFVEEILNEPIPEDLDVKDED